MDKKTWDQSHTIQSNKSQEREQKTAGSPTLKTQSLEFKDIDKVRLASSGVKTPPEA